MIGNALRIAAPDLRRIPPLSAFKPADQSITTAVVPDTDLYLNLEANSTYRLLATVYYTAPQYTSTQIYDFYGWFTTPEPIGTAGGWSVQYTVLGWAIGSGSNPPFLSLITQSGPVQFELAGSGTVSAPAMRAAILFGTVTTTNAGVLQFNASPAGGSAGVTVNAGSELDAFKTG